MAAAYTAGASQPFLTNDNFVALSRATGSSGRSPSMGNSGALVGAMSGASGGGTPTSATPATLAAITETSSCSLGGNFAPTASDSGAAADELSPPPLPMGQAIDAMGIVLDDEAAPMGVALDVEAPHSPPPPPAAPPMAAPPPTAPPPTAPPSPPETDSKVLQRRKSEIEREQQQRRASDPFYSGLAPQPTTHEQRRGSLIDSLGRLSSTFKPKKTPEAPANDDAADVMVAAQWDAIVRELYMSDLINKEELTTMRCENAVRHEAPLPQLTASAPHATAASPLGPPPRSRRVPHTSQLR